MARQAFIMGSDGAKGMEPLRYATSDAARIAESLRSDRCGFKISSPQPTDDRFEVFRQLTNITRSCSEDDTFVFYFSGHGFLERGELHLVWDNRPDDILDAALPIIWILDSLCRCPASNKLLILDCCHAGAARGMRAGAGMPVQELVRPDNYLLLMASERLETVREKSEFHGSFLASKICEALGPRLEEADDDGDELISLDDLVKWLERSAAAYNSKAGSGERMPVPFLYGDKKGQLFLTNDDLRWKPHETAWPDGSTMVILSVRPGSFTCQSALCMAKHPVTNAQYQHFVQQTGHREPVGQRLDKRRRVGPVLPREHQEGIWIGSFHPWRDDTFRDPDQPVVCVSYSDAVAYCKWVNEQVAGGSAFLPTILQWTQAAFRQPYPVHDPGFWLNASEAIHHCSSAPAPVDRTGRRSTSLGLSDLFGNIWEWCAGDLHRSSSGYGAFLGKPELRGGGFLDDLSQTRPFLESYLFDGGSEMCHFDVGFRVAGMMPMEDLPSEVQLRLKFCKEGPQPLFLDQQ
jgi:hypothetical protein